METQEINLFGVRLSLEYTIEGRASALDPNEQIEATIHKITACDSFEDLTPLLENYIETIYDLLNEKT
jgi:hypothetical protein